MTRDRRNRTVRRTSSVIVALGAVALVAVTPSAGAPPASPAVAASGAVVTSGPAAARGGRSPAAESVRFNPVAFRDSVAPVRPAAFAAAPGTALPKITTTAKPGTAAAVAIEFALAQRGLPYVWGGNGPQQGHRGFDCSGLTTYAYRKAGVTLPRTAHTQYYAGPHVPAGAGLEPGDLVFYGVPARVHHVGLYIGNGQMVAAPTFGKPVRISYVRYNGDDYLGATRPAAGRDADSNLLSTPELPVVVPPLPSPEVPLAPEEFAAPAVPPEAVVVRPAAAPAPEQPGRTGPAPSEQRAARSEGGADEPAAPAETGSTTPSVPVDPVPSDSTGSELADAAPSNTEAAVPESPAPDAVSPDAVSPAGETASAEGAAVVAEVGPPVALTWGGSELAVGRAEKDVNGLPSTPESADSGGSRWSPADKGRAARAVVALGSGVVAPGVGDVVTMRAADGAITGLTVRSRDVVDVAAAADLAFGRGESTRLVLLMVDPDTGEIVVLIAR